MTSAAHRIAGVLSSAAKFLQENGVTEARVDSEIILGHVLGIARQDVLTHPERPLSEAERLKFNRLIARRGEKREPVAYIIGSKEFYGVKLRVTRAVLIPRPDTETLVERLIVMKPVRVLDVGTGSGAIIAGVLAALPNVRFVATDISADALNLAQRNLPPHVDLRKGPGYDPVAGEKFDVIVSNPPYIASADVEGLEPEIRLHEPRMALDGGQDGLDVVRTLLKGFRAHAPKILVEIGAGQAEVLRSEFPGVQFHRDIAGIERVAEL